MNRTCDGGPRRAGGAGVAAALPLAASPAGAYHLEVDPIFVFPILVYGGGGGGGAAGHICLNGGRNHAPAGGLLRLFLQVALAPRDDHPQVVDIVALQRTPEDVGRVPERPEQLVRLVAGGHVIPRQDCITCSMHAPITKWLINLNFPLSFSLLDVMQFYSLV